MPNAVHNYRTVFYLNRQRKVQRKIKISIEPDALAEGPRTAYAVENVAT